MSAAVMNISNQSGRVKLGTGIAGGAAGASCANAVSGIKIKVNAEITPGGNGMHRNLKRRNINTATAVIEGKWVAQ
jgi:hypothetical protein